MKQDKYGWPDAACIYPDWLTQSNSWRNFLATGHISFSVDRQHLIAKFGNSSETTYTCLRRTDSVADQLEVTDNVAYVLAYELRGW